MKTVKRALSKITHKIITCVEKPCTFEDIQFKMEVSNQQKQKYSSSSAAILWDVKLLSPQGSVTMTTANATPEEIS